MGNGRVIAGMGLYDMDTGERLATIRYRAFLELIEDVYSPGYPGISWANVKSDIDSKAPIQNWCAYGKYYDY